MRELDPAVIYWSIQQLQATPPRRRLGVSSLAASWAVSVSVAVVVGAALLFLCCPWNIAPRSSDMNWYIFITPLIFIILKEAKESAEMSAITDGKHNISVSRNLSDFLFT